MPYLNHCTLDKINLFSLQPYISYRQEQGVKNRTINRFLQLICRILNLAHQEWRDEFGLTWLSDAPKIKLLPLTDSRKPYVLTWEEQINYLHYCRIICAVWLYLKSIRAYVIRKFVN